MFFLPTYPISEIDEIGTTSIFYLGLNFRYTRSGFRDTRPFTKLPYLGMKLGHWTKCQKYTYSSSTPGVEIELIFALYGQWFSRYWPLFKIAIFRHETGPKSRSCTCTLFLPQGVKSERIFTLRAVVSEIQTDFQNCLISAWNWAIGQSARSCTYTFCLPQGVEIEPILSLRAEVSKIRADFQNCHICAWNLAIGQSARSWTYTDILSFYVSRSKGSLFSLDRQSFRKYGILDLQYCRFWAWNLAIGQSAKSCTYTLFLTQGRNWTFFTVPAAISEIRSNFQNCHIWAWNLAIVQISKSCTCTLFLPHGVEIGLIFALRTAVSEMLVYFQNCRIWVWNLAIGQSSRSDRTSAYFRSMGSDFWHKGRFSKLPYLGMKLGHWPKLHKLHIYSFSTPWCQNWAYFCSTGSGFRDRVQFSKVRYLGM